MVDPTPSDYNLTYLRERWERDRSSRIFLQLAEEYRRRGLHAEALEVLQTGLAAHPGYLAAQVALGRDGVPSDREQERAVRRGREHLRAQHASVAQERDGVTIDQSAGVDELS